MLMLCMKTKQQSAAAMSDEATDWAKAKLAYNIIPNLTKRKGFLTCIVEGINKQDSAISSHEFSVYRLSKTRTNIIIEVTYTQTKKPSLSLAKNSIERRPSKIYNKTYWNNINSNIFADKRIT